MRDGKLKTFLYTVKIIPLVSEIQKVWYKHKQNPDRFLYRFLPVRKNKIVFDNIIGRGYGDNPKAILEEIRSQNLKCKFVWLGNKLDTQFPSDVKVVKYGSRQAMRELATAKVWIFNVRYNIHPHKKKNQVYVQTWHAGYNIKLIEKEAEEKLSPGYVAMAKTDGKLCDAIIAGNEFIANVYKESFWLNPNTKILKFGTPKNDILFDKKRSADFNRIIREKYGISDKARIILYMPTFRDSGSTNCYDIDCNRVVQAFEDKFHEEFVMFFRLHPNVQNTMNLFSYNNKFINTSTYPEACELYCAADFMISDYSGVMFPFVLTGKPVFIYANDLESYRKERGLNSLYDKIPCRKAATNDELIEDIKKFDSTHYFNKWAELLDEIKPFDDGHASARTVEWLKNYIK